MNQWVKIHSFLQDQKKIPLIMISVDVTRTTWFLQNSLSSKYDTSTPKRALRPLSTIGIILFHRAKYKISYIEKCPHQIRHLHEGDILMRDFTSSLCWWDNSHHEGSLLLVVTYYETLYKTYILICIMYINIMCLISKNIGII